MTTQQCLLTTAVCNCFISLTAMKLKNKNKYYLKNICLLCLNYDKYAISLNQFLKVKDELEAILPSHILRLSNIPKHICDECMKILRIFSIFRRRCINSVTVLNKYVQKLRQKSGSYEYLSVTLADISYQNNSNEVETNENTINELNYGASVNNEIFASFFKTANCSSQTANFIEPNDCVSSKENSNTGDYYSVSTGNFTEEMCKSNDNVEKMIIEEDKDCASSTADSAENITEEMCEESDQIEKKTVEDGENFTKTCYSVQEENSYNKNHKLFNQNHITEFNTDSTKNDGIFECGSCERCFTTAKQLYGHVFWCKMKNKLDGVDYFNKNFNEKILGTDSYENYRPAKIQQKKQNVEQAQIDIEDTLEKKEINAELIIKDELSGTHGDIFECETCELAFGTEIQLIDHTSWCESNKKSFGTASQIQNDCLPINTSGSINTFTDSKKKLHLYKEPYECDVCQRSFRFESALINHRKLYHTSESLVCEVCKKVFKYKYVLSRHKYIHTGEKPFACDVCNKSFRFKCSLIKHKISHTNKKKFACDVCNKSYTTKYSLDQHKCIIEKLYECDLCKRLFAFKSNLTNHECFHPGVKPLACDICNKKFRSRRILNRHKCVHTIVKSYDCDVCKETFNHKYSLKIHKKIHSSEKP